MLLIIFAPSAKATTPIPQHNRHTYIKVEWDFPTFEARPWTSSWDWPDSSECGSSCSRSSWISLPRNDELFLPPKLADSGLPSPGRFQEEYSGKANINEQARWEWVLGKKRNVLPIGLEFRQWQHETKAFYVRISVHVRFKSTFNRISFVIDTLIHYLPAAAAAL